MSEPNLFSNDSLVIYISDDNSTWTKLTSRKPVLREVFLTPDDYPSPPPSPLPSPLPYSDLTDNIYIIDIVFDDPPTTRYIKAFAIDGTLQDVNGDNLSLTEVEIFTREALVNQLNTKNDRLQVQSLVTATPPIGAGDGSGSSEIISDRTFQKTRL